MKNHTFHLSYSMKLNSIYFEALFFNNMVYISIFIWLHREQEVNFHYLPVFININKLQPLANSGVNILLQMCSSLYHSLGYINTTYFSFIFFALRGSSIKRKQSTYFPNYWNFSHSVTSYKGVFETVFL